ncbi:hypothetical protein [Streptomyces albidus (ex Kaewkla and Franco 2022)]|uniref:hypothetical protein n=1 Tax=Streptomyces albidus (ex Kaewkla and Franco 2022) TaxID=722709 RepID=UPI0015EECBF7|nr:hypothetical protein [Streptomyces albidus (ex Kaewkla and Franco 2022)]
MSSSTSTAKRSTGKRSRTRRAGESMYGMLLLVRNILLGLVVLLLLVAGGWTSWETAGPALTGDQRGTVRIAKCTDDECSGSFTPAGEGGSLVKKVTLAESASGEVGERLQVALRPGTTEAVRTGPSGALYGAVPFGGSLMLAALVVAGGLRWKRTALVLGLLGAALMGASWALLTF